MGKIVFLGLLFTSCGLEEAYVKTKKGVQLAPHKFQENLINGLVENNADITVLNIPPIGSYPINYKKLFIKNEKWGKNEQIGFLNLPYIKHLIQKKKLFKKLKKLFKNNIDGTIILYSMYRPFIDVACKIKKIYPNVKVCMIQTDPVPGRGDMDRFMTVDRIKAGNKIVADIKMFDKFVVLTSQLVETMEIEDKPHIVIECIVNNEQKVSECSDGHKNICLYTGTLNKEYGIIDLAQAFTYLPNAELWICGAGGTAGEIQKLAESNTNIKYFGFVTQERVTELQNECDFLINPRRPTGTYTKYSFPSKTAEYMMTEKPVIMYKLEGIPDEYDEYLNYLHADNSAEIAKELKNIFSTDYKVLTEKATRAREFMKKNKSQKAQAQRLLEFLYEDR